MKRLLLIVTGASLVIPDIALAQAQTRPAPGNERPVRPGTGGPQIQPPRPGGPQIQPPRPGNGGPQIQPPRPGTGGPQIQPPRPGNGGPQIQPPRPGRPGANRPRPPHRPGAGRPPNFRPIHWTNWQYPRGYRYRRWVIGAILPRLFLADRYYFNDYDRLGIGGPPRGYRWVRYGPDLLLVGTSTGRVYDVIYGAFR